MLGNSRTEWRDLGVNEAPRAGRRLAGPKLTEWFRAVNSLQNPFKPFISRDSVGDLAPDIRGDRSGVVEYLVAQELLTAFRPGVPWVLTAGTILQGGYSGSCARGLPGCSSL